MFHRSPKFRRSISLTATLLAALFVAAPAGHAATRHAAVLLPGDARSQITAGDAHHGSRRPWRGGIRAHASIIGGYAPHPSQWPWMAALTYSPSTRSGTDMDRRFCGGALIAPRLVLTAAHCVTAKDGSQSLASTIQVVIGKRDLALTGGEHLDVQAIERHPAWDFKALRHDLALLYLATPSSATPAALVWPDSQIPLHTVMTVMGWGRIHVGVDDRTASSNLKALDMSLWGDADCAAATTAWSGDSTLYDPATQLCVSAGDNAQATCKGDSGGPLMFIDSTNTWRLYGVVSYGTVDCSPVNAPDVFAWLGATDMLSFVTRGITTASALPAPVSSPAAPAQPSTPATVSGRPPTPSPTPGTAPSVVSDTTAPSVFGLRVNPRTVRTGRKMSLYIGVGEGGTLSIKLRGPDGARASASSYVDAGANIVSMPARIGRQRMRAGRWAVTISVIDAAGNRSRTLRSQFRVAR